MARMSVTGLCTVCGRESVEHTCDRCGGLVCDRHYDAATGYCIECAGEVGGGQHEDDRPEDGDTYQF